MDTLQYVDEYEPIARKVAEVLNLVINGYPSIPTTLNLQEDSFVEF